MGRLGWASATLTAVLVLAACGPSAPTSSTTASSPSGSSSTTSTGADPLDATTWRSTFTCDDMVRALHRAGLQKYEAHVLNGLDCEEVRHTTLAFSHGREAINGEEGDLVQPYELVNDHTFINGFQRVTFQIRGERMILHLHIIESLYPYSPKELPLEHAYDVGFFQSAPYERMS